MMFTTFIGIDYSGRGTPLHRLPGLQVYAATGHRLPERVNPLSAPQGKDRNWCRKEVAEWLLQQVEGGQTFIAGIDHAFSFPAAYFQRNKLSDWESFWPTFASTGRPIKIAKASLICERATLEQEPTTSSASPTGGPLRQSPSSNSTSKDRSPAPPTLASPGCAESSRRPGIGSTSGLLTGGQCRKEGR